MTAISIHNISKKYTICPNTESHYSTLIETLSHSTSQLTSRCKNYLKGNFRQIPKKSHEEFWALKGITLDIEEGDRVGIIGRNGAGKSTLLKLISRITHPTSGKILISGNSASLLELGTGFHLELTGRENIFLNGSILGMKRKEIMRKFDEIVAFSEIEQFLETPMKRYSSGMLTRLGFAIAAHLDPDILIVDEVLAVGDMQFQEKCLKKLNQLGDTGRTILFVSHDVGAVLSLCNKGICLDKGQLVHYGPVEESVDIYTKKMGQHLMSWKGSVGDQHLLFYEAKLHPPASNNQFFYQGDKITLSIDYEVLRPTSNLFLGAKLCNKRNQVIAKSYTHDLGKQRLNCFKLGRHQIHFTFDSNFLYEGDYLIKIDSGILHTKQILHDTIALKLPLFQIDKNTSFSALNCKNSIYLGNSWKLSD